MPGYEIDHDHSHVGSSSLLGRKQYEWLVAEFWWQDKRTPDSADVPGQQLVVWGDEDRSVDPPRCPHQIDPVTHHGLEVCPTPQADL